MTARTERVTTFETSSTGDKSRKMWSFERGSFWTMNLSGADVKIFPAKPAMAAAFGEVKREEAKKLADAMGLPDSTPVLRRLSAGKRCYAAWINNEIVVYGWVSQSVECIGEIEHEIHLQPEEAYIWDCATLPRYRQKGLYTALLGFITSQLRAEGLYRAWIGSSVYNQPSLQGFSRAGFLPVVTMNYYRLNRLSILYLIGNPISSRLLIASARTILTTTWRHFWGPIMFDYTNQAHFSPLSHSSCSNGTI